MNDFGYLGNATKLVSDPSLIVVANLKRRASEFTAQELVLLQQAYDEVQRREDGAAIMAAIEGDYSDQANAVRNLINAFNELHRRNVGSYSRCDVVFRSPQSKVDWGKLPHGLAYLAAPAVRWSAKAYWGESEYELEFSPRDRVEPEQLSLQMNRDSELIREYLRQHPISEHQEAWMVYRLDCIVFEGMQR